jgi:hypothetical protein
MQLRMPAALAIGVLAISGLISAGEPSPEPLKPLLVLSLPNGKDFTMPLDSSTVHSGLVPVGAANVVALRIAPRLKGTDVVVRVSLLLGDTSGVEGTNLDCAAAKSWARETVIGSYRLSEDDPLLLAKLERYAV